MYESILSRVLALFLSLLFFFGWFLCVRLFSVKKRKKLHLLVYDIKYYTNVSKGCIKKDILQYKINLKDLRIKNKNIIWNIF